MSHDGNDRCLWKLLPGQPPLQAIRFHDCYYRSSLYTTLEITPETTKNDRIPDTYSLESKPSGVSIQKKTHTVA
jgi:hypothetical protein